MSQHQVSHRAVFVEGDKNGFNSKSAFDKFKYSVKSSDDFNLSELSKKYVKNEYYIELLSKSDSEYKFTIQKNEMKNVEKVDPQKNRELLRAKLHNMNKMRTNGYYTKARANSNVPADILAEYKKISGLSKMPIPEPSEILANPEQYKPILSMVMGNSMMKNLPKSHPYVRYFKLLAEKIGVEQVLPIPTQNFLDNNISLPNNLDQMINMSGDITNVKGNEMSKDEDTDSEEDYIEV